MKTIKTLAVAATLMGIPLAANADVFSLSSPDIIEGELLDNKFVFKGFGCTGDNISPTLSWKNAPKGTKSFALTAYDPDAPTGSGWWHWFAFNIPVNVMQLHQNAGSSDGDLHGAVQLRSDYGTKGFGGACPPTGEVHRYKFTIHALSTEKLDLDENVSAALAGYMVNANSIATSTITAVYKR